MMWLSFLILTSTVLSNMYPIKKLEPFFLECGSYIREEYYGYDIVSRYIRAHWGPGILLYQRCFLDSERILGYSISAVRSSLDLRRHCIGDVERTKFTQHIFGKAREKKLSTMKLDFNSVIN